MIKKRTGRGRIDEKRFSAVAVAADCPKCGGITELDYLSYPRVGEPFEVAFYCCDCGHEWNDKAILTVQIEPAP